MNTFVPVLYVHDGIKISYPQRLLEKICALSSLLQDCRDRVVCMDLHDVGSGSVIVETASVCQAQRKIFSTIILRQQMENEQEVQIKAIRTPARSRGAGAAVLADESVSQDQAVV